MGTAGDLGSESRPPSGRLRIVTPIVVPRVRVTEWILPVALAAVMATGCGGSSSAAGASSRAPSPEAGTSRPVGRPSGSLPPEAAAKQGGKYYAVFLAVAPD